MKRSRFSEQQIAFILLQAEEGVAVEEVCRKAGVSMQTYYRWRKKYGGLRGAHHDIPIVIPQPATSGCRSASPRRAVKPESAWRRRIGYDQGTPQYLMT